MNIERLKKYNVSLTQLFSDLRSDLKEIEDNKNIRKIKKHTDKEANNYKHYLIMKSQEIDWIQFQLNQIFDYIERLDKLSSKPDLNQMHGVEWWVNEVKNESDYKDTWDKVQKTKLQIKFKNY